MQNIKLIFIRHGENNKKTGKLTKRGVAQIKESLKYLKNEKIDAIFCSPRPRTLQTANIINTKLNVPLYIMNELNERQSLTPSQMLLYGDEFNNNYLNYDFDTEHFESCKKFIDRCVDGLNKIVTKTKACSTVMICAHSSTLYAINAYINGIPKDNQIKWLQCSNGAVVKFYI